MALPSKAEYGWLEKLPEREQGLVFQIRETSAPVLGRNLLPHFTDHSIAHSDRVVGILERLLEGNLGGPQRERLNDDELMILIAAAIMHDLGMQVPKAHGIVTGVDELTSEERSRMRHDHGLASGIILRNVADGRDEYATGLPTTGLRRLLPHIATLCERHQSHIDYDPGEVQHTSQARIRVGLLTSLLRLADQLDCSSERVRMEDLQQITIPPESILHWVMCHYVDSVSIESGIIVIYASYPKTFTGPVIDYLSEAIVKKTSDEYEKGRSHLWKANVRLDLPKRIITTGEDFSYKKLPLPDNVEKLVLAGLTSAPPVTVLADPRAVGRALKGEESTDFMSYWGLVGNPFLDRPVAYGSEFFIETPQVSRFLSETEKHLAGKSGDLRLVVAPRGMGKTTLFKTIEKRIGHSYDVRVIDVADRVLSVRSGLELFQMMTRSIAQELDDSEQPPTADRVVEVAGLGKKKVICIDSLDRLPREMQPIVVDFFKLAQRFLTDLRSVAVILLSCDEKWLGQLRSDSLSFLGLRNLWELGPFSTEHIREMLSRRIRSSGRELNDLFDASCPAALHALSKGNPREVLGHAEAIARLAAKSGEPLITAAFIRGSYRGDFDKIIQDLLTELARESPAPKRAIGFLYVFYLEMERRNLDGDEGWRYLLGLLRGDFPRASIPIPYYPAIQHVTEVVTTRRRPNPVLKYRIQSSIKEFFALLRKNGISPEDFVSFYAPNPFSLHDQETEDITRMLALQGSEEHLKYYERARQTYLDLKRSEYTPTQTIRLTWESAEALIQAILMRHAGFDPRAYEAKKEKAYYQDRFGIRRLGRGAGSVLAQAASELVDELMAFMKANDLWLRQFPGLLWMVKTRNNVLKAHSTHLTEYTTKDREVCLGHLDALFKELLGVYDEVLKQK